MTVKCECVSYPAVHLSFPPAVVSFLGEDFDGVSLPQRELGAVTRREIIAHFSCAVVALAHTCTHTHTHRVKGVCVVLDLCSGVGAVCCTCVVCVAVLRRGALLRLLVRRLQFGVHVLKTLPQ